MIGPEDDFSEERYQIIKLSNSHEDSKIKLLLQRQKYHQRLSLELSLNEQNKISLVGECLSNLNHLKGFHLIANEKLLKVDNSLNEILKALKTFHNLTDFKFEILREQYQYDGSINSEDIEVEMIMFLVFFPQLEKLQITIPSCSNFDQFNFEEIGTLKMGIEGLKNLKEIRWNTRVISTNQLHYLNEFLASVNSLRSLTLLSCSFNGITSQLKNSELQWKFAHLNSLQELHIKSVYCELSLERLSEELKYLSTTLIRLKLSLKLFKEPQDNKFLNTVFNLKSLEELTIHLSIDNDNFCARIGEEIDTDSCLKILQLTIQKPPTTFKKKDVVFGKQILKIKQLKKLSLKLLKSEMSKESFSILTSWSQEWTQLEDLTLEFCSFNSQCELLSVLSKSSESLKSLKNLDICFSSTIKYQSFDMQLLCGLGQLTNLQILTCLNLYSESIEKNEYVDCFKNLPHLKELRMLSIKSDEEIELLGQSFQYMTTLVVLKVEFFQVPFKKHFEIFCTNLSFLKSLRSFTFFIDYISQNDRRFMNIKNSQLLLQGLLPLKTIIELKLPVKIQVKSQETFDQGIEAIMKELSSLYVLSIRKIKKVSRKNRILKQSSRLVKIIYNNKY